MSIVEELRRNDPARKWIHIHLSYETSDADLAQALEQNSFVTEILVDVGLAGEQQTDWNSLLRVIAARANLEKVTLQDADDPGDRTAHTAGLVRAFLLAIQRNTAIRNVELRFLRLPTDISTFVDTASSITKFSLNDCEPSERQQGARSLAVALQRNKNIQSLKIYYLEGINAVPILEALRSNTFLKAFGFSPRGSFFSDAASHALRQLLESTTSIQRFELGDATFSESLFCSIAQSITSSECVSELEFRYCEFQDQSSIAQLRSILQNKRNLTTLCFDSCEFVSRGRRVHEDIISLLSRPDSPLRSFEFQSSPGSFETVFPRIPFEALLRAIEKSKIERFKIGRIESRQQLQTLTQSIRSMKLKGLEIDLAPSFTEALKHDLLRAVENNFTLLSVKGILDDGTDFFDSDDDKQRLAFYANRNERLDRWADNPEIVEQRKVWPEALNLAQKAGPNALFRGLRSVFESDYVSLPGSRKRKRPQHNTPA